MIIKSQTGIPLAPQPAISITGTTASVTATTLVSGTTYQIEVRATGNASVPTSIDYLWAPTPNKEYELSLLSETASMSIPYIADYDLGTDAFTLLINVTALLPNTQGLLFSHASQVPSSFGPKLAGFWVWINQSGSLCCTLSDGKGNTRDFVTSAAVDLSTQPHTLVIRRQKIKNRAAISAWLDGQQIDSFDNKRSPVDITTTSAALVMGSDTAIRPPLAQPTDVLTGTIRLIKLWNTALSSDQIPDAQQNATARNSLIGMWNFADGKGNDATGRNPSPATLGGGAAIIEISACPKTTQP